MKHESQGAGKETRGSEERQKRSGIGGWVSERLEGAEIVGIRGKKRRKRQYYCSTPHQGSASLLTIDRLSFVWQVVHERQEGQFA